jgi:predicted glycosyltransferase
MKIFIDIGHPADVHFFRNFIKLMEQKGHTFFISARNRSIIHYLLEKYDISFINRGKGSGKFINKLLYMFSADIKIYRYAKKFKPDLFLSFSSPYASQVSWLMRKPHITFNDTEHTDKIHKYISYPFSEVIVTPSCYYHKISVKQIKFNGYKELCYLHSNYFTPDGNVLKNLGIENDEKYFLIRFVSWNAFHDLGQKGLSIIDKRALIEKLEKHGKVFISSEENLPKEFAKYRILIPSEKIHDVIYFANFLISESGTMASEAAILNTPVIYVNSLPLMGYLKDDEKNGMLFHFNNSEGVMEKTIEMMNLKNIKETFRSNNLKLLSNKINPTEFLIWFIENWPKSFMIMKENPAYQERFQT